MNHKDEISSSTDQTQEEAPTVDGKLVNCSACENPRSKQVGSACPKCGHILQAPPATVLIAGVVLFIILSFIVVTLLKHGRLNNKPLPLPDPNYEWLKD